MQFTDQIGKTIFFNQPPKRIVSLVPSQTELLFDLGLNDEIVGITKFCIHPKEIFESKIKIGGTKQLNINKIKELNPDLIIANKEENVKEQIEELARGFSVWTSDIYNLQDSIEMIEKIGELTDKENVSKAITKKIKEGFNQLRKKNKRVLYLIWNKPFMAAGQNTFIGDMLNNCGLINVIEEKESRYPELSKGKIEELNPDFIFLSSEPYPFSNVHLNELTDYFPKSKIILVDGEMFSWYGSRLIKSADYLNQLLTSI